MSKKVVLKRVTEPLFKTEHFPVSLTFVTMQKRREKIFALMKQKELDCIIIYCDTEHGTNFEYLTGFITRFEEGLLVLHADGEAYMLLGNENTKMVDYSRLKAQCIHVPFFSLPNQPMQDDGKLTDYFKQAKLSETMKIGIVGWKLFTSEHENNEQLFDLPYYIVDAIKKVSPSVVNATDIFISPSYGARITNNANEFAHYEFGSALASKGILEAMNAIEVGKSEMEIASLMNLQGQRNSVITICATGKRFENANLYPSTKLIELGDRLSLTVSYKGGLSSRSGYVVRDREQLPHNQNDYLEAIVKPYFATVATWLEEIHIGMLGKEIYELVERNLPKDNYNWVLNPGHLTGDEEWLSSMIYPNSLDIIQSGMLMQVDIIPSVKGYAGISVECTIGLADETLRNELKKDYPKLWDAIILRQQFLRNELGIMISDEILPMSDTVAYCRPYLLDKTKVLAIGN